MNNVIPFRKADSPAPVYVEEENVSAPVQHAERKTMAVAQLKKAAADIENGEIDPDGMVIIMQEDETDARAERMVYYSHNLNRLELIGLVQTAVIAFTYDSDEPTVTGR